MITCICKWNRCAKQIALNDIKSHIGSHIGYHKKNSFYPDCKWPGCNKVKSTRGELQSHVLVHFNTKAYICKCGKAFKRKYDRAMHAKNCIGRRFYNIIDVLFLGLPKRDIVLEDLFN